MRLAIQEPRIKDRFPRLQCLASQSMTSQGYSRSLYGLPGGRVEAIIEGEEVTLRLEQDGHVLALASWTTAFPEHPSRSMLGSFLPAKISGEGLLLRFFRANLFTSEDLAELARSKTPEVRSAAAAYLPEVLKENKVRARVAEVGDITDQAVLAKTAFEDADARVRSAAVLNLTDQSVLAKMAIGDLDDGVRNAAVAKPSTGTGLSALLPSRSSLIR